MCVIIYTQRGCTNFAFCIIALIFSESRHFPSPTERRKIMQRKRMSKSKDRRVFRGTADKTQTLNIKPRTMRGGIRL